MIPYDIRIELIRQFESQVGPVTRQQLEVHMGAINRVDLLLADQFRDDLPSWQPQWLYVAVVPRPPHGTRLPASRPNRPNHGRPKSL